MRVYARIKPCPQKERPFQYVIANQNQLLKIQQKQRGNSISNKECIEFQFEKIFEDTTSQETVFDTVAVPIIQKCLEGYNGTIFAYGQTGSGKTYTMSGSESWQLRGIIPRAVSYIFDEIDKRQELYNYQIFVSYMEIYNENAYDLLDKKHLETPIESWNKIILFEDDYGNIHLKNVSVHECANEQEGIDLLMMGNFIRQVSATPINQSSSRSHAVFTLTIDGQVKNSDTKFVSKLHLVDLAGSERISKSQVEGTLLNEAKHINLSLTYLEQVIIALNDKHNSGNRSHVPYRNSMMTTILKDSLGGNCDTIMIANINQDQSNQDETISTLRFSQRVGQLENEVSKNEELDYEGIIQRLQNENSQLKQLLEQHQGSDAKAVKIGSQVSKDSGIEGNPLTEDDISKNIDQYLNQQNCSLQCATVSQAQQYFAYMKQILNKRMKEYVSELTFISEKLQIYEELLYKKRKEEEGLLENQKENEREEQLKSKIGSVSTTQPQPQPLSQISFKVNKMNAGPESEKNQGKEQILKDMINQKIKLDGNDQLQEDSKLKQTGTQSFNNKNYLFLYSKNADKIKVNKP